LRKRYYTTCPYGFARKIFMLQEIVL